MDWYWRFCFFLAIAILIGWSLFIGFLSKANKTTTKHRFYLAWLGAYAIACILLIPYFLELQVTPSDYQQIAEPRRLSVVSRVFLILHNAMQAFTLDFSSAEIVKGITAKGEAYVWYAKIVSVIPVICPLFTFSAVSFLFKDFWARMQLRLHMLINRPTETFIFSDLNEKSLAFARSIEAEKRGLLVFANTSKKDEDAPDLLEDAKKLHAICFRKPVEHIPLKKTTLKSPRSVHFMMIGDNESAQLSQALELAKLYKNRSRTEILLYSSSSIAGKVIDTVHSTSRSLSLELARKIDRDPDIIWSSDTWGDAELLPETGFHMRRIDPIKALVTNTLCGDKLVRHLKESADNANRTISLTIVGLGTVGKQFLKTAVWLYQAEGYFVEINVFDKRTETALRGILDAECPELLGKQGSADPEDARYSICFYGKTDCLSSSFERILNRADSDRLRRTQAVFVTLGNDDQNIEASIRIRVLFDQIKCLQEKSTQFDNCPWIYSVVFDDEKYANLDLHNEAIPSSDPGKTDFRLERRAEARRSSAKVNRSAFTDAAAAVDAAVPEADAKYGMNQTSDTTAGSGRRTTSAVSAVNTLLEEVDKAVEKAGKAADAEKTSGKDESVGFSAMNRANEALGSLRKSVEQAALAVALAKAAAEADGKEKPAAANSDGILGAAAIIALDTAKSVTIALRAAVSAQEINARLQTSAAKTMKSQAEDARINAEAKKEASDLTAQDIAKLMRSAKEAENAAKVALDKAKKEIEDAAQYRKAVMIAETAVSDCERAYREFENAAKHNSKDNSARKAVLRALSAAQRAVKAVDAEDSSGLRNYKGQLYHIDFIGNLSWQYNFQTYLNLEKQEKEALSRHLSYMVVKHYIIKYFSHEKRSYPRFRQGLIDRYRAYKNDPKLSDETIESLILADLRPEDDVLSDKKKTETPISVSVADAIQSYYSYEYYRDSSIATDLHKRHIIPVFLNYPDESPKVRVARLTSFERDTMNMRRTEHIRWNAYMRSIGYRYGEKRFDRGQIHPLIVRWEELNPLEHFKD